MKKLICILLALLILFNMSSCLPNAVDFVDFWYGLISNDGDYIDSTNWSCTTEEFVDVYIGYYNRQTEELKALYGMECLESEEMREHDDDIIYIKQLYNNEFTIEILFANRGLYGDYRVKLCYFSQNIDDLNNYEKQKKYVDFINDITNAVAFDTKTDKNHFEALYFECLNQTKIDFQAASNIYHFDQIVGDVGYGVAVHSDSYDYYHKIEKNENYDFLSNGFSFEGVLKPLGTSN